MIPRMLPIWYDMRQYQPCINVRNIPVLDGYLEVWVIPNGFNFGYRELDLPGISPLNALHETQPLRPAYLGDLGWTLEPYD